ncbi:ABC transporter ATP-binding protein [Haladaptatus caseinilyticus]|uniref:ABC transporter ATP-binding protein n=1 Tax=Haladaptatus caseinilyticus TaxID=2993314 RepID=UPI0026E53ECF|nr:oligopeptide/dipeptide ABC transporter ATP-binding protein [Haladaptatus caseinilyticus]
MSDSMTARQLDEDDTAMGEPLLEVEGLTKHFTDGGGFLSGLFGESSESVRAVEDVSFTIHKGETLGLVGESGCGKSTLARTILRLLSPTEGTIYFKGQDLTEMGDEEVRNQRKDMQMIFQDPQSSLDPRMKIGPIVEEPMKAHGMYDSEGREERARELLEKVGLDPQHYNRHPHAFSGGQRQRVNLARALSVNPDFIVCDEPVSSLDVSIQAQVLNTMRSLQDEFGLTYLFIAHDLSVIRHISDRVAVMYLGQMVELADKEELYENPQHPYTQALLESIPVPDPRETGTRGVLEGDVPSPIDPPSGCRFRTRCPKLIAPPEYELSPVEWEHTRRFLREVQRRSFEPDGESDILVEFFDGSMPDGDAGRTIDEAIKQILRDDWDGAKERLTESFAEGSICAKRIPDYEVPSEFGTGPHDAACHRHRDDVVEGIQER